MVFRRICLANGGIAFVRTGCVPMVPALDAAVPEVGLDTAYHHVDGEHYPYILRLAPARAWTSVGASWLDCSAGVRIRRDDLCNRPVAPNHSTGRATMSSRICRVKAISPHAILASQEPLCVIEHDIH